MTYSFSWIISREVFLVIREQKNDSRISTVICVFPKKDLFLGNSIINNESDKYNTNRFLANISQTLKNKKVCDK